MMMTTSDKDGEALTAVRKANAMLMAVNMNWEEFLNNVVVSRSREREPNIEEMFDVVLKSKMTPSFYSFILSINKFYLAHKFLTPKQLNALKEAYSRRR
jgi:hypothetical protein